MEGQTGAYRKAVRIIIYTHGDNNIIPSPRSPFSYLYNDGVRPSVMPSWDV